MKNYIWLISLIAINFSCVSESDDSKLDQETILQTENVELNFSIEQLSNGLECEDVFLSKEGGKIKEEVTFGDKISMNFQNIKGLNCPNNKCEIDMMFLFSTLDGDTLDYYPFGSIPPIIDSNEVRNHPELSTYCFIVSPTFSGESYYFTSGLRDKNSGNEVIGKSKITVKENGYIHFDKNGLNCREAFVYDPVENYYITDNTIKKNRDYDFALNGVEGFKLDGGKANLGIRLKMSNDEENDPFDSGDLVTASDGLVNFSDINELLSIDFVVHEDFQYSSIHVEVEVWDKNSDASITYWSDFTVID